MTNPTRHNQDETRAQQRPLRRLFAKHTESDQPNRRVEAVWNGAVIAESGDTVIVEGNHYFPADAVRARHLRSSSHHSVCPWKGTASYYDVVVEGEVNRNAAWHYPNPTAAARHIANRIAFWRGVSVRDVE